LNDPVFGESFRLIVANVFATLLKNLFDRRASGPRAALASDGEAVIHGKESGGMPEVWLYPDSEELHKQTLLKARKIDQPVFLIGRRVSGSVHYPHDDPPDLLIVEQAPFTLSKVHCQLELAGGRVVLRDLGSRSGTVLGRKRLRGKSRQASSMVVPKGTHLLVLGYPDGPFRFRLEVR
jgi:hypothetical protein